MRSRVWDDYISERHVENAGAETEDGMRVGGVGRWRKGEGGRQVVTSTRGRELSSDTFSESNAAQYSAP